MLTWILVGKGRLSVRGRPGESFWRTKPEQEITRVVTLLSAREGAGDVGKRVSELGLEWTWLPLENANIPMDQALEMLRVELPKLALNLLEGESIVIHCSAGIHRTGMIAYAVLRLCGLEGDTAQASLMQMRSHTGQGVGQVRLAWGDQFVTDVHVPKKD